MFKVHNKDTEATSLTFFYLSLFFLFFILIFKLYFLNFSSVSVVDFEQMFAKKGTYSMPALAVNLAIE